MRTLILGTALSSFAFSVAADPVSDVRCQEIGFSLSAENRDIEAFKSFLDDDARFIGNSVVRGSEEIVAAWQMFFSDDGPTIAWRPQFVEVLDDGNLALTRGPFRMVDKDPEGFQVEHWGTFNSVWRKSDDGKWRVIFDAGNSAEAPPDDQTRALLNQEDNC